MLPMRRFFSYGPLLALASTVGCSSGSSSASPQIPSSQLGQQSAFRQPGPSSPIQHVVLIMQENHSFDNLFQGFPGANTQSYGYDHKGKLITLKPIELGKGTDLSHQLQDFISNYDKGKMDGFDINRRSGGSRLAAYTYIEQSDIQPYFDLGGQYVLSDDYFPSHLDASFAAHQFLIAAQSDSAVNIPLTKWGCDGGSADTVETITGTIKKRTVGPPEVACFGNPSQLNSYETLGDLMDQAGLSWRWYSPTPNQNGYTWMAYQAVAHIRYGPDWNTNIVEPETQILTDIANGQLANMTWVSPTLALSDHPGSKSMQGPSWVSSIVNAIGSSPFWSSTAIFVVWDEWGGEFDHVPPPQTFLDGLGIRVPMLCISPYAYTGVVNHTQLESAGILTFVENTFGLPRLQDANGNPVRDSTATDASTGCLNFSQKARPFTPVRAPIPSSYFKHLVPYAEAPNPDYYDD